MNVWQMLKHCILLMKCPGQKKYKQKMIGHLFGKLGLRQYGKTKSPCKKIRSLSAFKIQEPDGDVTTEKKKCMQLIDAYDSFSDESFTHWFFGKMTKEQVGQFVFKHNDHHLRQFNV